MRYFSTTTYKEKRNFAKPINILEKEKKSILLHNNMALEVVNSQSPTWECVLWVSGVGGGGAEDG